MCFDFTLKRIPELLQETSNPKQSLGYQLRFFLFSQLFPGPFGSSPLLFLLMNDFPDHLDIPVCISPPIARITFRGLTAEISSPKTSISTHYNRTFWPPPQYHNITCFLLPWDKYVKTNINGFY